MHPPSMVLDHLLSSCWLPARWNIRLDRPCDLPVRLESCVESLAHDTEWRAYSDGARLHCVLARGYGALAATDSEDALELYFLNQSAAIEAAGVWTRAATRSWRLSRVLEPSGADAERVHSLYAVAAEPSPPWLTARLT